MSEASRIAVMGAGAVGGYFGALLARSGQHVAFIARGAHLEAIRRHGLSLAGPRGDFTVSVPASAAIAEIGAVDVVLFCVKQYHTEQAARLIEPLVAQGAMCVCLMNGVDGQDR